MAGNSKSLYNMLKTNAAMYPENVAIIYDTINVTYSKLFADAWRKAVHLQRFKGDRIAVYGPASYRWIVNVLGVILSGKDVVLVDFFLPQEARNVLLKKTHVDYILSSTNQYILADKNAIIIPNADKDDIGDKLYDEQSKEGNVIMFTATLNENDKPVRITTENIVSAIGYINSKLKCSKDDRVLSQINLFHTFGLIYSLLWPLSNGACVCIGRGLRHIDADTYYYNPTILPGTPSMIDYLRKIKGFNENLKTVIVGGASCPFRLFEILNDRDFKVYTIYGHTENCDCIGYNEEYDGSFSLFNEENVMINDKGEILVRGLSVASGYDEEPECDSFSDGYFYTGDKGHFNKDGRLVITANNRGIIELPTGERLSRKIINKEIDAINGVAESYTTFYDNKLTTVIVPLNKEETLDKFKKRIQKYNEKKGYCWEIQRVVISKEPLIRNSEGNVMEEEIENLLDTDVNHKTK